MFYWLLGEIKGVANRKLTLLGVTLDSMNLMHYTCPLSYVFFPWLQLQAEAALEASRSLLSILPSSETTTNFTELKSWQLSNQTNCFHPSAPMHLAQRLTQPTSTNYQVPPFSCPSWFPCLQSPDSVHFYNLLCSGTPVAVTLPTSLPSNQLGLNCLISLYG